MGADEAFSWTVEATAGPHGSISPVGVLTLNQGESQAYTITAEPGYHIADVLVDGSSKGSLSNYTITNVSSAHTIVASFSSNNLSANFTNMQDVPLTVDVLTLIGNTANFSLNFAPIVGTDLTVVNNTGLAFIQGKFDNLNQGQAVNLTFGGITYPFVANYFGGNGNDLVLQWANARLLAWGYNSSGQLGNNVTTSSSVPVPVFMKGSLDGKVVIASDAGGDLCLAVCSDGTVVTWGDNTFFQLVNGSSARSDIPVLVDQTGVLSGRTVVSVATGNQYCLALCSDGRVAGWGRGDSGQLGRGTIEQSYRPVLVSDSGVFAGKIVVAIAAGSNHALALCSDGTLASWGGNNSGKLGNKSTMHADLPVLVDRTGVLSGKTVIAIAAGEYHSLVLCSDGTLAAWGNNFSGQLGNNSTISASVPVLVDRSGVLFGKTVTAIAAGGSHNLVLCSDGSIAAWGQNTYGQLGNNSTSQSNIPIVINSAGVLAGKMVTGIAATSGHSLARCSDGSIAAWGYNNYGQLGNNSTSNSKVAVEVNTGALNTGERFTAVSGGNSHSLATVSAPPKPAVTTLAATGVTDTAAALNGTISAQGSSTSVSFEYGTTTSYGLTAAATPATLTGAAVTAVATTPAGLTSGTTYHYRVVATSAGGTVKGEDMSFTTSTFASLASLTASTGTLLPAFDSRVTSYSISVPNSATTISFTPVVLNPGATVTINDVPVESGTASGLLDLTIGNNPINIKVTAAGGGITKTYTVTVTRLASVYTYNSATYVPMTVPDFEASDKSVSFALSYAPSVGTDFTVVKNTGLAPIRGTFDNLSQGQRVTLTYNGVTFFFVANYFGGTGNDLVLQWASNRLLAWGANSSGQLGTNHLTQINVPVAVVNSGELVGKTILTVAAGSVHSLALCSDGTLAAWGANYFDQLGNNSNKDSAVPVLVDRTGVLAGKTVVAIAVGANHQLALCSDGTLVAWGSNDSGQLGNNSTTNSKVPVLVDMSGVLVSKRVVAIAAGLKFSLALCADGTVAAWGGNASGQLGNNSTTQSNVPVLVNQTGVLAGKTVTAVTAGGSHSCALCSDGSIAAWGSNDSNQLGNNSTTNSSVPVLVDRTGVLVGRTPVALVAGASHSLALCADGTLVAWGANSNGGLGNNSKTQSNVPVMVTQSGVLAGKTVVGIAAGQNHSLARCSDGTLATWGTNFYGQLGNNSTTNSMVPVLVATTALKTGERIVGGLSGLWSWHNFALVASPPPPLATTLATTGETDTGATMRGNVSANGTSTSVSFEYGLTTAYGTTVTASPATLTGTTATAVSATLSGLLSGTTYHYRVVATSNGGTVTGDDLTFTTSSLACLSFLTPSNGTLSPAFASSVTSYLLTVPNEVGSITVTPVVTYSTSTVKVNGVTVASDSPSGAITLSVGNNTISTVVTATGGTTKTYSITVTRLPAAFAFASATTVPVTASAFAAAGNAPAISLSYAPDVGTILMVVKNTGYNPIRGTFANLAQGQVVYLTYNGISYAFTANYFGGTGNDLVLQWANNRLMVWGRFQSFTGQMVPMAVPMTGILSQKTVIATATGSYHKLVLCSDNTLVAWGSNPQGQLGNGTTNDSSVPQLVDTTGVLAGKTIVAITCGFAHCLVLCADGTLAAWGDNGSGQLGNGNYVDALRPVLVSQTGILAGKTVVGIAAGRAHNLALCSDGTIASWGSNSDGQLGNTSVISNPLPTQVSQTGALSGKTPTAIAVGAWHSMAVCSDGTLAAWGDNAGGQLGNNTTTDSSTPVAVDKTGVLSGKTITAAAAGQTHSLALCSDGTVAAWGSGSTGKLGNGTTGNSNVPVLVDRSGVLVGKTVTGISSSIGHNLVVCADGTLATWGSNSYGELGINSTTSSSVPVLSITTALRTGERFVSAVSGDSNDFIHRNAVVASPPRPAATTLAATGIGETTATLNASVMPNNTTANLSFQLGLTQAYDTTVTPSPVSVSGTGETAVSVLLEGLAFGTTYHYRVVAANANDTGYGDDMTFTTQAYATLSGLSLSNSTLAPGFSSARVDYSVTVPFATDDLTVTPAATDTGSTIQVNGASVTSGATSAPINLAVGNTVIQTVVTGADPANTKTYTVVVTRLAEVITFQSETDVPVTVSEFAATGNVPGFALNFAPATGSSLTVVRKTGNGPIQGAFGNLAQGQLVQMIYGGVTYSFVADYFGGTGNDLVLQWANMKVWAWGANSFGQLGNNSQNGSGVPVPVVMSGVLAGKTVTAAAVGSNHNLALCVDGSVAAWGLNGLYQVGSPSFNTAEPLPKLTDRTGVLAGKRVIAVAASSESSVALCSDGTLATWGGNKNGILGNNSTASYVERPVLVDLSGVLIKKSVVAISATNNHILALCSDGTVAAWGDNSFGQLGNNSTTSSSVPVLVDMTGVLAGKQVTAIAAGSNHSLVLCADGTLAAWGYNAGGQLGNNSVTNRSVPVLVDQTGVLAGKTITAIHAGSSHSLVICSDGTMAAWGNNSSGEVGDNTATQRLVPVRVSITGVLAGKTIRMVKAGDRENLALFADGTLAAWGRRNVKLLPTVFDTSTVAAGDRLVAVFTGALANHCVALSGSPPPPGAVTTAASGVMTTSATLNGTVNGSGVSTTVSFEYGLTTNYGTTVVGIPSPVTASSATAVSASINGLTAGTTYHYRTLATNANGNAAGLDMTFTTNRPPTYSGYAFSTPYQTAASVSLRKLLAKGVDPDGDLLTVTAAGPASTMGGTVALQPTAILYTPPASFSGIDTFALTLSDGRGGTVIGTVTVTVGPAPAGGGAGAPPTNPPVLTMLPGGHVGIQFQGIPSRSYQIERSTDMVVWQTIATVTAGPTGTVSFTDESPPQPSAYYQLALP